MCGSVPSGNSAEAWDERVIVTADLALDSLETETKHSAKMGTKLAILPSITAAREMNLIAFAKHWIGV